jgi:hypothetical protein
VAAVVLTGLHRVSIEKSDQEDVDGSTLRRDVARHLHTHRNLGEDFHEIHVLQSLPITISASVEIAVAANADGVLLEIYQRLGAAISPTLPFSSLTDLLARGGDPDTVFDGPALARGQVDMDALKSARRQTALYASDIIREIMAAPGVRAVRSVRLSRKDSGAVEQWSLALDDANVTPSFDSAGSSIRLFQGPLELAADQAAVQEAYVQGLRKTASSGAWSADAGVLAAPTGVDRAVAAFFPLQDELPAAFGLALGALPPSAPEARKAQAAQLRGYLGFFDQILANGFSQLAHARDLLSFDGQQNSSYFTQLADTDGDSGASPIHTDDFTPDLLQSLVEQPGSRAAIQRRHQFADHLLARFGEEISAHPEAASEGMLEIKQAFLRDFLRLSGQRGTGRDSLETDGGVEAALAARVRLKLGLADDEAAKATNRFYLIDHILLRPLAEDAGQRTAFLTDAASPDPFSLQLSFVFPAGLAHPAVVESVVREETPAHLVPYIHWLDDQAMAAFVPAFEAWNDALREYWLTVRLGLAASGGDSVTSIALRFRAARDRLIDLLGLGRTFPLRDLPAPDQGLTVPYKGVARVPVECTQKDVIYRLYDKNRQPVGAEVAGTGDTIILKTPAITDDITYFIRARKIGAGSGPEDPPALETDLIETANVKVGLDAELEAVINPLPGSDPRIAAYGAVFEVELRGSQEGVDYRLVHFPNGGPTDTASLEEAAKDIILSEADREVRGTHATITLRSKPAVEDTVVRIRATKRFDPSDNRPTQTTILTVALRLSVRADPARTATASSIVDYKADTGIRIAASQASVTYQLWTRRISDIEYRHGAAPGAGSGGKVVAIPVTGAPDALVLVPGVPAGDAALDGFAAASGEISGTGGELRLPLTPPEEDLFVAVQARKRHTVQDGTPPVSTVWLTALSPMLVRPDPRRQLRLQADIVNGMTTGTLRVLGGQPGVFYTPKLASTGAVIGPPAYFHKLDAADPRFNKGIGQLKLSVDFVVAANPATPGTKPLSETPPESPSLPINPLAEGTAISFRAVKAQTGVAADMAKTVTVTGKAAG